VDGLVSGLSLYYNIFNRSSSTVVAVQVYISTNQSKNRRNNLNEKQCFCWEISHVVVCLLRYYRTEWGQQCPLLCQFLSCHATLDIPANIPAMKASLSASLIDST